MSLKPKKWEVRTINKKIFEDFKNQPGSHSISNLRALELLEIFVKIDVTKNPILEIGAGLGTVTTLLLSATDDDIYAHEYQEACLQRLDSLKEKYPGRLHVSDRINALAYKFVVIDGPYDKKEMLDALRCSKNTLCWIAIENGRTSTRIQISSSLFKLGMRQQVVEFRRANYKPSLTLFFLDNVPYRQNSQILSDYILAMLRFWPKYLKLLMSRRGSKHFRIGKKLEGEKGVI